MQLFIIIYFFVTVFGFIELFSVLDYGMSINDIFLIILALIFLKDTVWKGKELTVAKNPAIMFFLLQLAFVLISAYTPIIKGDRIQLIQYLKTTSHFFLYTVIIFIAFTYRIDNKVWIKIIKIWLITSIFINLFGMYQLFARIYDLPFAFFEFNTFSSKLRLKEHIDTLQQATLQLENFYRATSIFKEPAGLATFNLLILIFSLFPLLHKKTPFFKSKLLIIVIVVLNLISLMLTYSLTAVGVLFFLVIGHLFLTRFRNFTKFLKYFFLAVLLLLVADNYIEQYVEISILEMFTERVTSILTTFDQSKYVVAESLPHRLKSASESVNAWMTSPIIGVGLGLLSFNTHEDVFFADSSFFMVLSQTGILGAVAFTVMFAILFIKTYRYAKKNLSLNTDNYENTFYIMLFYLMIYLSVINFFTANNYVTPYMWSYLAIVFAMMNNDMIKNKYVTYKIKLVDKPLELKFNMNIAEYINKSVNDKKDE